jgi:ribulose-5-phosphate 4-epimerase/fuculose-1-phosphate aldolase
VHQLVNANDVGNFFYQDHSVYPNFGGTVLDEEEANNIANALGNNSAVILQNHGLLTVGHTVDEATYLYGALDRLCHGN